MKWEKIFANNMTDMGLLSKICKQLIQFNTKKQSTQFEKMGRRPKQIFFQRRQTDGQQAHEKMLNIANYQINAIKKNNEIPPHIFQNGYHQQAYT